MDLKNINISNMMRRKSNIDTPSSDALLAQQLVEEEQKQNQQRQKQEESDVAYARKLSSNGTAPSGIMGLMTAPGNRRPPLLSSFSRRKQQEHVNSCPGGHGLQVSEIIGSQRALCNKCKKVISSGNHVYSCSTCDFDICSNCVSPEVAIGSAMSNDESLTTNGSSWQQQSSHMCHIACLIGGSSVCVEMMVDTGAQSSVISSSLARELGLRIDTRTVGIASGVGQARITGMARDVPCTFNGDMMEFTMNFLILEMKPSQRLLIMGLDQMRKYKCLVDLERNVLIFGGTGGLEVPMLPPAIQHNSALRNPYDFRDPEACHIS